MTQKAENDNFGNYSVDGGESYVFTFMKEIYIYIANIFKILTFVTGLQLGSNGIHNLDHAESMIFLIVKAVIRILLVINRE